MFKCMLSSAEFSLKWTTAQKLFLFIYIMVFMYLFLLPYLWLIAVKAWKRKKVVLNLEIRVLVY